VRLGEKLIPEASAQFDAHALEPRPSPVLQLPTDAREGVALVMLPPEVVLALHELPSNQVT
jgi:hypothetical protein